MTYLKVHGEKDTVDFKKYKSTLQQMYSDERTIAGMAGSRKSYYDIEKLRTREQLQTILKEKLNNPVVAAKASETLAATNGIYADIIEYYTNLPLYRYTVIPSQYKKIRNDVVGKDKYAEVYERMISVADGISIEVAFPKILQQGLVYGIIYIYADKDKSSETVETLMLPFDYCKKGYSTNFGTDTVVFDFKFFDDFKQKLRGGLGVRIEEEEFFALFPVALVQQYDAYKKDVSLRFQQLDPKFSAAISFNLTGIPPKFYANFGLIDYEIVKSNEIIRSSNELEKILTHEIPHNVDGDLMFDLEEAFTVHDSMAKAIAPIKGLKLLTTFGATNLIELQSEKTKENKAVEQSFKDIFNSAGINPQLFNGDSPDALRYAGMKDAAYIFKILDQIVNFYNVAINNLFNFSPYQASINLLHISIFDEIEKVSALVANANFGIGKLQAIIAAGIKQKDIYDTYELEQYLELEKILTPLQSSYTSTPSDVASKNPAKPAAKPATKPTDAPASKLLL